MRLVDAYALKAEIIKKRVVGRFNTLLLIDQAPTVTPVMAQVLAYESGKASAERSQGEWIIVDDTEKFIAKCSICGRIEDSRKVQEYPFCHCGADMRGNKKETTFADYLKKQLKDPEFRKEWEKLCDEEMRKGGTE